MQIRITSQTNVILLELFSFSGATKELIERKYFEFINYTISEKNDLNKISFSDKIDLITKFKNEGKIGYEKGMFDSERNHIQESQELNIKLADLAKDLTKTTQIIAQNQSVNLTNSSILVGNGSQISQNVNIIDSFNENYFELIADFESLKDLFVNIEPI